jgi:HAD superfamily hydrolase (TIGR01509 family)
MIRAILFDCFGVLYVDVRRGYYDQFPEHADELHDLNQQADHGFIDKQTYIASVAALTGMQEVSIDQAITSKLALNQPLVDYIRHTLKPQFQIGLVSNIGHEWIDDYFDKKQRSELFDMVIVSGDEGVTKPNPLIFERAAYRLNLPPEECVMIDDRPENCAGAEAVGMKSILFTSNDELRRALDGCIAPESQNPRPIW